ncbi:hypothetical protein [Faecalibaculum rodentium]|uniref:hypothetical protein n=1 Tax=Faecalibaculum rodentium TaxID=1702221 RepID=UPI0025B74A23|nr:hypothetical protein [Faecalibaculum rodentium]
MKRKEARQMIYNIVRQYYGKQPKKMSHEDEIDFENAVHCEPSMLSRLTPGLSLPDPTKRCHA